MKTPCLPAKPPHRIENISLEVLFSYLARGKIEISLSEGGDLAVSYEGAQLPSWLKEAIAQRKKELVYILKMRQKMQWLHDCITGLRYKPTCFKGLDREACLERIRERTKQFAEQCDLTNGYNDPGDLFSESALTAISLDYHELTYHGNPYPVAKDDPRERYPNGKIVKE